MATARTFRLGYIRVSGGLSEVGGRFHCRDPAEVRRGFCEGLPFSFSASIMSRCNVDTPSGGGAANVSATKASNHIGLVQTWSFFCSPDVVVDPLAHRYADRVVFLLSATPNTTKPSIPNIPHTSATLGPRAEEEPESTQLIKTGA